MGWLTDWKDEQTQSRADAKRHFQALQNELVNKQRALDPLVKRLLRDLGRAYYSVHGRMFDNPWGIASQSPPLTPCWYLGRDRGLKGGALSLVGALLFRKLSLDVIDTSNPLVYIELRGELKGSGIPSKPFVLELKYRFGRSCFISADCSESELKSTLRNLIP
jgi:hypothetical protein